MLDAAPLELILFDLDGTLYHSTPILHDAYTRAVDRYRRRTGRPISPPTEQQIFSRIGQPVDRFYPRLFPELNSSQLEELKGIILEEQIDRIARGGGVLADRVHEVLPRLQPSFRMGLVTNARRPYMETVLNTHDLSRYFDRVRCIGDVEGDRKGILVRGMLEAFGVGPDSTLLIGDRESDYRAARDTGVQFLGCHFGFGEPEEFEGARRIHRLAQLLSHPPLQRGLEAPLASEDVDPTPTTD